MNIILELVLIGTGFISIIPVIYLFNTPKNMKYRCLKFLVNSTFLWSLLIFVERISENTNIIYYAHMLGYPLKFLMASFMLCTIYNYIERKLPRPIIFTLVFLFLLEYGVAITNAQTLFILKITPAQVVSYDSLYSANNGPLFIVHLILTYSLLLISITYLMMFLRKRKDIKHYQSISKTMVYSVIIVLGFNILQVTLLNSNIDLTYISLVIVTFMLYQVIYRKDMMFNLKTSGRGEILSNMREIYILTDNDKKVVEISKSLQEKYNIDLTQFEGKPLILLLDELKKDIVVYEDYDIENTSENSKKDHYHLREKMFSLNKMNEHGYMILLYDETQVFSLLRELNKLSNYDNMTGLNNRNYLESKISSYKDPNKIGIISLDLNGLKANNDYLGHERGDYLLKKLANKMKTVMSKYDGSDMARIGGDEFLIILKETTLSNLNLIKKELLDLCENDDLIEKVSVSIGIAIGDSKTSSIYSIIQEADADMYRMKKETSNDYSKEIVLYVTKKDKYIR